MKDPAEMSVEELDANSSYDPNDEGMLLRMSKSSFVGYGGCPRQYWWSRVQLKGKRMPETPAMARGKYVHTNLETLYDNWDGQSTLGPLIPEDRYDPANEVMTYLEECRIEKWGIEHFAPYEYEVKRVVWDAEHEVVLVGLIDGILIHPDGGLCIYELKTGNMASMKFSKTRKELCYYTHMLRLMGETRPITHFAYLSPDAFNPKFVAELCGWKNDWGAWDEDRVICSERGWLDCDSRKEVAIAEGAKGFLVIEALNARSITSFNKSLKEAVDGLKSHNWDMKWNDYFCPQWCDFSMSCESERNGLENLWGEME